MANAFTTEAFTLLGVGVGIVTLRLVARTKLVGLRGLQMDDYLMCFATIVYAFETATAYAVGAWWRGLANNGMTPSQRANLDPASEEYALRTGGSKTQLVGWNLYVLLLWSLKLCMCHFYSRLTVGLANLELRVKIGYGVIAVTYTATMLSIMLGCRPFNKNWQIQPDPGNVCQPAVSKIDLYVTVVLNVLTDMYLLSIPLPMLWRANLELKRKVSLLLIFSGGVFVMMAGILRCALIISDPIGGAQAAGSWAVRETFVAVIIGNLPMVYPYVRRGVVSAYSSSNLSRSGRSGRGKVDDSLPLNTIDAPQRHGKFRSVNALPTTCNGTVYGDNDEERPWASLQSVGDAASARSARSADVETGREHVKVATAPV